MTDLRFSRRTVIAAIEVMEGVYTTAASLTRCFLKFGSAVAARCDAGSLKDRFNHLIKFYDEDPTQHTDDGELLQDAIINEAISLLSSYDNGLRSANVGPKDIFLRALNGDGFAVREGRLIKVLPPELGLPQAEDDITRLLKKHGFLTSKGHLDQALTAHGLGSWAAANSQLRAFYESLFDEIANKICPMTATMQSSENRRAHLATIGFLQTALNEWSNDGKNFVNGLFKRLHPQGSHPGLSDQEDSAFRRHVVLITAKLFLVRLDSWPGVT